MKGVFVELYLDEDVSVLVAELLRSHGFNVLTAEAGQIGQSDEVSWPMLPVTQEPCSAISAPTSRR